MSGQVLIVGIDGTIGNAVLKWFQQNNKSVIATSRRTKSLGDGCFFLDLENPDFKRIPHSVQSAIFCAAVTDLSFCQKNHDQAKKINVDNTLLLARELNKRGVFITFLSTNLVFDGATPNTHWATTMNPKTVYGTLKAEAEIGMEDSLEKFAIIRLSKVVSKEMTLLNTWMRNLDEGITIQPFSDYRCAPIDLQTTIKGIARVTLNHLSGIWQFSPEDDVAYSDIALEVARQKKVDLDLVESIESASRITLEHIPRYATLDASFSCSELNLNFFDMPTLLENIGVS
jgi:dTDP-4-dehydrorhamnose reductase